MRRRERHAVLRRVVAQRCAGRAAELEVERADRHALRAQVFREDAADFAVADEGDAPAFGILVHLSRCT